MLTTRCRSCGAPIVWAETTKGKRMPVDAAPVLGGNVELVTRVSSPAPLALVQPAGWMPLNDEQPMYVSHYATCPQAAEWRRS